MNQKGEKAMMDYAEERMEEKRIVETIALKVANLMGWELMIDPTPLSNQAIITQGKKKLYFHLEWRDKNRLSIAGGFDYCSQYLPYKQEKTKITVSLTKPVERIVKDIQSRLLPGYEKMLAHALEQKAKDDEYKVKKQADLEEIARLLKEATIQDEKVWSYTPRLTCKYWLDGEWELTTTLSKEILKKVLIVINEGKP